MLETKNPLQSNIFSSASIIAAGFAYSLYQAGDEQSWNFVLPVEIICPDAWEAKIATEFAEYAVSAKLVQLQGQSVLQKFVFAKFATS